MGIMSRGFLRGQAWRFRNSRVGRKLRHLEDGAADNEKRLAELRDISVNAGTRVLAFAWAGRMLGGLGAKGKGEMTYEEKRRFAETSIAGITVTSAKGRKLPEVEVRFRFDSDFERAQKSGRGLVPAYMDPRKQ